MRIEKKLLLLPFCQEVKSTRQAESNEKRSFVSVVWQLLYSIMSSSVLTLNDVELIAVHLW